VGRWCSEKEEGKKKRKEKKKWLTSGPFGVEDVHLRFYFKGSILPQLTRDCKSFFQGNICVFLGLRFTGSAIVALIPNLGLVCFV
jgi:hypothetical protein